ncbi:hypothetical protein [Adhaeribacter radiodurans]|uniref:Uncharacterized protein n=1 Tax=Adhaeribacter radiodurans TaxID=2745197 RepID=A0A7L7L987_9BACT|nr:hypothetical protein [Adhaeribacter radiodurans]QMU29284.1 hypothetical protein HUW48_15130 [Adhaeribacter radiodurans]
MKQLIFLSLLFLLAVIGSCEKAEDDFTPRSSSAQSPIEATSINSQSSTSTLAQESALQIINFNYGDVFYTINLDQVKGISREQFTQWLQGTRLAPAKKRLLPLLSHSATKYILLKNVKLRATGKLATVALIGVPNALSGHYASVITVINQPYILEGLPVKLCFVKKCSPYLQCINWIAVAREGSVCPSNQCDSNNPCTFDAAPPGTTIGFQSLKDAIAQFQP